MPLGRSILKNCRANASCVNCYVTLSINLPIFHGRNQARDNAQSPLSAPSVRTPAVYCTAASLVLPAVPGCCRIRPPRLAYGVVFTGNSPKEKARNFSVHQEVSGFVLLKLEIYCSIGFIVGTGQGRLTNGFIFLYKPIHAASFFLLPYVTLRNSPQLTGNLV